MSARPDPNKLYWVSMEDSGARCLIRPLEINDGAGVEFYDYSSGDYVGFAGINWWRKHALEHVPPRDSHRGRPSALAEDG